MVALGVGVLACVFALWGGSPAGLRVGLSEDGWALLSAGWVGVGGVWALLLRGVGGLAWLALHLPAREFA